MATVYKITDPNTKNVLKLYEKDSFTASDRARAENARTDAEQYAEIAQLYMGTPFIREINGTYQDRPPVEIFPNVTWFGIGDPTVLQDFEEFDPVTGHGDVWIEVQPQP